jgi:two-component system sensor histidine kinase DesK
MLVFPVAQAVSGSGLNGGGTTSDRLATVGAIAAFAAVYAWYWLRVLPHGAAAGYRLAITGMLVIIGISLLSTIGTDAYQGIAYMLIYVAVVAAFWNDWKVGVIWCLALGLSVAGIFLVFRPGQPPDVTPVILVTLVGLGMVGVRRMINTIEELRSAQDELSRLAVGEERMRFARDLHDLLGHGLSTIVLKSEVARNMIDRDPKRAGAELADIEVVARQSLRDVRAAVAGYRQTSLNSELRGAREMLESAGISVRWERQAGDLPADTDTVLAWAVREGATNVLRHSGAHELVVRVARDNRSAYLEMIDDGRGRLDPDAAPGNGLAGLGERVAAVGGQLRAEQLAGKGFRLSVQVPVNGSAQP